MPHKLPCYTLLGACATSDAEGKVIITGESTIISFGPENGFMYINDFETDKLIPYHVAIPLM